MNDIQVAKITQVEMLHDRHYIIDNKESWMLSVNDQYNRLSDKDIAKRMKKLQLNKTYTKINDTDTTLYVHYCIEDKLITSVRTFIASMEVNTDGILICASENVNDLKKKKYSDLLNDLILKNVQIFSYDDLSFNITKHVYSPKYELIDKSLIIPSMANAKQLPVMFKSDAAVRYYGFPAGSVIKITEELFIDTLVDYHITYCIVTNQVYVYK